MITTNSERQKPDDGVPKKFLAEPVREVDELTESSLEDLEAIDELYDQL